MSGAPAGWGMFAAAYGFFLVSHALPASPAMRHRLVATLGERLYLVLYSLVSLAAFAWLIAAADQAPYLSLWTPAPWQFWVPNLAMPLACLLAAYGLGAANPLSFGGRRGAAFDPQAPGIAGIARHPLLWAIVLWSGAHAVPNGDLAHLLLFGTFALFALAGMAAIDRRQRRRLGEAEWRRLAGRTSALPLAALLSGRWRPAVLRIDPLRLAAAVVLYLLLVLSHQTVIGVSPLPPGWP